MFFINNKQWGTANSGGEVSPIRVYFPLWYNQVFAVVGTDYDINNSPLVLSIAGWANNSFLLYGRRYPSNSLGAYCKWIAIGTA